MQVSLVCDTGAPTGFRQYLVDNSFTLQAAAMQEIKDNAAGASAQVTCHVSLQEGGRLTNYDQAPSTHTIKVLLSFEALTIAAVDRPRLLVGPWVAEHIVDIDEPSSVALIEQNFKQVKCAMTYLDQLGQRQVILSDNEVLTKPADGSDSNRASVKCYFFTASAPRTFQRQASYCLEFAFERQVVTETCSQQMAV